MVSPFETVILKMRDFGMFQFMLPFMMTSAIFYGLLRKSQILGDPKRSVTVNGTVALVAAFMVWASPIIMGIDIEAHLTAFFVQGMSVTLVTMVGLMIVGMIAPPDLPKHFENVFKDKPHYWMAFIIGGILVASVIAVSSGLINVYFPSSSGGGGGLSFPTLSEDSITTLGVVLLLLGSVILIFALA